MTLTPARSAMRLGAEGMLLPAVSSLPRRMLPAGGTWHDDGIAETAYYYRMDVQ
jgi:hypothetical protein